MAPKNSRTSRPAARSSRAPQSARAVRSAKAAQSGRIASRAQAGSFSQGGAGEPSSYAGYRSAYTPGSQGSGANGAYGRQTAVSQYSRNNASYSTASSRKSNRGKKIAVGVLAALLVAVVGGGTAFAFWMDGVNRQLNQGTKSESELSAISDALKPVSNPAFTEPFYMMLIGSDRLDDDPSAGARSDTNIVVRVDPAKNQATMASIPRDTKIEIDGYGTNKFNAAYNYSGAAGAIKEASKLLNVDISHYAEVNFEELKGLVDAVGGVDIVVDERVDDPDADGTSAHPEWPRVIIEEGEQHLDGNQALVFARSRAYVDGDFTRTANQRKLIMAIVNKVLALPVTELPGVIQSAAQSVTTDLSVNDIISLAQQFRDDGELTIYSAMLPSYTQYINEVSYVINDAEKTKEMMKVVDEGGDPSGITSAGGPSVSSSTSNSGGSSGYVDNSLYYGGSSSGSTSNQAPAAGGTGATGSGTGSGGGTGGAGSSGAVGAGGSAGTGSGDANAPGGGGASGSAGGLAA